MSTTPEKIDWRAESKRLDEEFNKRFPLQIRICEKQRCMEVIDGVGNEALEQEIATVCGVSVDDIHGEMIELAGHTFRVECIRCLGGCLDRPRVDIDAYGYEQWAMATVSSLSSLQEQARAYLAGTWNRKD